MKSDHGESETTSPLAAEVDGHRPAGERDQKPSPRGIYPNSERAKVSSLLLVVTAGLLSSSPAYGVDRPLNVVLIVADDLGASDLGSYGSKYHRTPNFDRLAAQSRRFTQAYAASPVCSPTRAALMTGKHPARLNLTDWLPGRPDRRDQRLLRPAIRQELPLEEFTLAEAFKASGYATAHIGKWHLGGTGFEPTRQGFDLNIGGDAAGTPLNYFAPFARSGNTMPGLGEAKPGDYLTDRLTTEAEQFITAHRESPFFLYLPHFAVHTPLTAKKELVAKYPPWDGTPHGRQENPIYAAMLESLDESVGRIVAALERADVASRTIVVFTSDNGGLATREGPNTPSTNNSPLREGKGWLYEGGLRVPLLIHGPGIAAGLDATPVWSADVYPTLLALCSISCPGQLDGKSLALLLTKGEQLPKRQLHWHYPHYSNQGGRPGGAIRDGDWKLVEYYDSDRHELYNLAKDPGETTNLSDQEPKRAFSLAGSIALWRTAVGARMPSPNPDYVANEQAADGTIILPARSADVHGVMLRYEPLPHKNTLGYWVRPNDWSSWEFDVRAPGTFEIEALVGCGNGSGGSRVDFRVGQQTLELIVPETGGFQKFVPKRLGRVTIAAQGRARVDVRARSKPGPAVMDLREIRLLPVASKK